MQETAPQVPRATADHLRAALDRAQLDRVRGMRRRIAAELDDGRGLVGERVAREIENLLDELDDVIREGEEAAEAERLHRQARDKRERADERSTARLVGVGDGGLVFDVVEGWDALALPLPDRLAAPAVAPRPVEAADDYHRTHGAGSPLLGMLTGDTGPAPVRGRHSPQADELVGNTDPDPGAFGEEHRSADGRRVVRIWANTPAGPFTSTLWVNGGEDITRTRRKAKHLTKARSQAEQMLAGDIA